MDIEEITIEKPEDLNFVLGQAHFIKTVEDLYEALVNVPGAQFGLAFCEASGSCLIRAEGNNEKLQHLAISTLQKIGAGHSFIIFIKNCFPISALNAIKNVPEVCRVYCATANPTKVLVAESAQGNKKGRGIIGVIDGYVPEGVETPKDAEERKTFLRTIGYKR